MPNASEALELQSAWASRTQEQNCGGPLGPWHSVHSVPVIYHEETAGVVLACYAEGCEPTASEAAFLEAIADQAAVAIENSQLLEHSASAAALAERQRLARELHDSVSQALYAIGLSP